MSLINYEVNLILTCFLNCVVSSAAGKTKFAITYFIWSTGKNDLWTIHNIRKIVTGQRDDSRTGCLLDYPYFKEPYKLIAMDLNKQQNLDTDPKIIEQINFNGKLDTAQGAAIFCIIEETKKQFYIFPKEQSKY